MKLKLFISFAACVAASVLMSSCSDEESTATTNGQLTAFTGGIVTEAPMEREQIGTSGISTLVPGIPTRTSMGRETIGGIGTFFWEPNDAIYVKDDSGTLYSGQCTITTAKPRATFFVKGSFTGEQHEVYYCGASTVAAKVFIASQQTQKAFNDTKHFGADGDCGVALAVKNTDPGKSGYKFNLDHKASYLCFLPYVAPKEQRESYKIKSIKITSKDNNITGTYDLTQAGLSGNGDGKTITLNVGSDGLLLANQTAESPHIENSLYVVIAPGTRGLKVDYTVFDTKTNKEMTITKSYKSQTYAANKIYEIPVSLAAAAVAPLYSGHNYYMWDAAENYWSGHEWDAAEAWQPTAEDAKNDNYPKSKDADGARWWHEGSGAFEASNDLFKQLPNANEMAWYVAKGDVHWDNSTQWVVYGTTHTGGIWLKRLSVIAQENGKTLADLKLKDPNDKNLLTSSASHYVYPKSGKPADSEIGNYFFLPALGYYLEGQLYVLGSGGSFWSSSADPANSEFAYFLNFTSGSVAVEGVFRDNGCVAQPFE